MRSTALFIPALFLMAGCSGSEDEGSVAGADESAAGGSASSESIDYDVPEAVPGLFWFFKEGDGSPWAIYGPIDAGGDVSLGCEGDTVEISLISVSELEGRETATVRSGPLSGDFESKFTDGEISTLEVNIPTNDAIAKRLARDGFTISFPNGEENAFPPDGKIALALAPCID